MRFGLIAATVGLLYAKMLVWFASSLAAGGHGIYSMALWMIAPLGSAVYFWPIVGFALGFRGFPVVRQIIIYVLIVNYCAAAFTSFQYLDDTVKVFRAPLFSFFAAISYLVGQMAIWVLILKKADEQTEK